jgi:hypothetical protein
LRPPRFNFPNGKKFAFTVVDDTDVATVANVSPIYALLRDLGMRTTKTVWPLGFSAKSPFTDSDTLEDPPYLEFVRRLQQEGFEITWHSPTMESSTRPQIIEGLSRFREAIGHFPRIHLNHGLNRENIYWGDARVDLGPLRWLLKREASAGYFQGHVPDSEYWWGDECERHIEYARNLTFNSINLATVNPTTPYHDPRRPLVAKWFSSSDAEDVDAFTRLISSDNQDQLEREGGFCIVATHFGKGFVRDGAIDERFRQALEELAGRPGWFPTTGELLDWLVANGGGGTIPRGEWRRMQLRFTLDALSRRIDRKRGRQV